MRSVSQCNVCVVGGAGFLGSHLVNHLIENRQCKVWVIDNLVAGRREFVHPYATFIHADITGSEHRLYDIFKSNGIQYVMNYAAEPYIPVSFARPLHVFNTNAVGALQVINAAEAAKVRGILQVSSAEIYGGIEKTYTRDFDKQEMLSYSTDKIKEDTPVIPHSSYGAAKAAIDAMVQVRWKEAGTPAIALRQFNCVGERETHQYIVPEIISQLSSQAGVDRDADKLPVFWKKNPAIVNLGNNSFRDFLYAGDAVRLAVEVLEYGDFGEVYNLGSQDGIKMYDLARMLGTLMGFPKVEVKTDPERIRPWEIWHLCSSNDKVYGKIPSRPKVGLEEALRKTIAWYEVNGRKWPWEVLARSLEGR